MDQHWEAIWLRCYFHSDAWNFVFNWEVGRIKKNLTHFPWPNKWSFVNFLTFCIFKLFFSVGVCADSGKRLCENSSLISLILSEISSYSQQRNIQISFQRVPFGISKWTFPTFQFYKTQGFVWFRKHFLFHVMFSHLIAKISSIFHFGFQTSIQKIVKIIFKAENVFWYQTDTKDSTMVPILFSIGPSFNQMRVSIFHNKSFCRFPYFLPCFIISGVSFVVVIACLWIPVCIFGFIICFMASIS